MARWSQHELDRIGTAEELEIASLRRDGTMRDRRIWVVREGDELFVRSVNGPDSAWYRGSRMRQAGRVWAGGVEKDVTFEDAEHDLDDAVDAEYRSKYGRYSENTLNRITSPDARSTTYRLVPDTETTT